MANVPPGHRRVENSRRPPSRGTRLKGSADPTAVVLVDIVLRRRPDAKPLPDHAYWTSVPLGRRKFLSRLDFAQQFGAALNLSARPRR